MGELDNFIKNYEDVTKYGLDADDETTMIEQQNECTFCWTTADGSPMAVIMSYLEKDGKFWLTASSQRKRIPAIRRDPRVAIVITSRGAKMGGSKTVTYKGTATIHDDRETKDWFYPEFARPLRGDGEAATVFQKFLDSPHRVIIETEANLVVAFDTARFAKFTNEAIMAGMAE